jgi:hypothetical protein
MPSSPESGGSPSPEEALRRLEQRLDQASEAAERLMAQATAEAAARAANLASGAGNPGSGAGNPVGDAGAGDAEPGAADPGDLPPAGWQTSDEDPRSGFGPEVDSLVALVQAMRDLIPPDLQRRLIAALREVLLALRALIDWYLERLDRRREQGVEVQDIPIL